MAIIYQGTGLPQAALTWRNRFTLGWGKVRRFCLLHFRPAYVRESLSRRVGSCHRTGACCMLMFPCPLLDHLRRLPLCRIYTRRPANCQTFPIDERDLRDRDLVNPWEPCGFSFRAPDRKTNDSR
jgi:hypothetical protein